MHAPALPYGLHTIEDDDVQAVRTFLDAEAKRLGQLDSDDIDAVIAVLQGPLLAQGPEVAAFEEAFSKETTAEYAVACSSGTAALHLALSAVGVQQGDTCIVPAITFISTASAGIFCGANIEFADVDPITGLMTPESLSDALERAGGRAKAVLPVHLGGRLCDIKTISEIAHQSGSVVIEDCCHALGSVYPTGEHVGSGKYSSAAVFSFHPVKTIACGEGGMVTTNSKEVSERIARLRNHGVTRDPELMTDKILSFDESGAPNPWSYEQIELGFNYRMTDLEAALGRSQLKKLSNFVERRRSLVKLYNKLLKSLSEFLTPIEDKNLENTSYHIYSVRLTCPQLIKNKSKLMRKLIERGIGTQVHYIPVYRQPFFESKYGKMRLSGSELYYNSTMTLPLFPSMNGDDVHRVVLMLTASIASCLSADQ